MLGHLIHRHQRGMTLVELMVGLALGLVVVLAASAVLVERLRDHRGILVEARLMQDLRTSIDIVTRDLRRAGYWGGATKAMQAASANPYAALAPTQASANTVSFGFSRDASENNVLDENENFGFRLRKGVIEMLIGGGTWQAMTDAGTMTVDAFAVTPSVQTVSLRDSCEKPCDLAASACGPVQMIRGFTVSITARSATDAQVRRSLRSDVRLRNDAVLGACPA